MGNRKPSQPEVEGAWDMRTGERLMTFGAGEWDREVMSRNRGPNVGTAASEGCSVSHLRNTGRGALLSGLGFMEAGLCC